MIEIEIVVKGLPNIMQLDFLLLLFLQLINCLPIHFLLALIMLVIMTLLINYPIVECSDPAAYLILLWDVDCEMSKHCMLSSEKFALTAVAQLYKLITHSKGCCVTEHFYCSLLLFRCVLSILLLPLYIHIYIYIVSPGIIQQGWVTSWSILQTVIFSQQYDGS